tara:strand:+ start:1648 stop:1854 length:207 start_codon:yes stop_codon:yes gene_type:complete
MVKGPRGGKMKPSPKAKIIAGLRQIAPGVMVNDNYKPGKDSALDTVIDKLKKDPSSLDRSGFGNRTKI